MPTQRPIKAVLFDLDGTLLDTAPDLADALNHALHLAGRSPLPFDSIRPMVSFGSPGLMRLAFNDELPQSDYDRIRQTLLDYYAEHVADKTGLFAGMDAVLDTLSEREIVWGVVTNKPKWLTQPLLQKLNLEQHAVCVVSGDEVQHQKPHPEPLYLACKRAQVQPANCVYIGDASRDIQAGVRAGMRTLAAEYGYIPADEDVQSWGADARIDHPSQILDWLAEHA